MFRAYRYRLYPNVERSKALERHFGCARWVYNWALARKMEAWQRDQKSLSRFALQKELPAMKADEKTAWLKDVNSQSLQASLANLDSAYVRFFREKKGFPKFKSKHGRQSFQCPQNAAVDFDRGKVYLPKIGEVSAVISRTFTGKIKTATVSRSTTGKYFASVLVDDGQDVPAKVEITEAATVGVDLGLTHFATFSTGEKIDNPRFLKGSLRRLRRAQRSLSRRKKGSNNRAKQCLIVARKHEKVRNQRNDFLHKFTTKLVRENQAVAVEDLNIQGMMQNPRLARSISDAGWGMIEPMLRYKTEREGKHVLVIGRFEPSSKLCTCGKVNHDLKLSDRSWTCVCGLAHDRDFLAANNIKRMALHPQNFVGRDTAELTLGEIGVG